MNGVRLARLGLALAFALASIFFAHRGLDRLRASQLLRQVEFASVVLSQDRRFDDAVGALHLRLLAEAAVKDPANHAIRLARGGQYLLLGRHAEAAVAYREALALERRAEGHLNLARALHAMGQSVEAGRQLEWALRLNPALRRHAGATLRAVANPGASPPR